MPTFFITSLGSSFKIFCSSSAFLIPSRNKLVSSSICCDDGAFEDRISYGLATNESRAGKERVDDPDTKN